MPETHVMDRLVRRSLERQVPLSVHFDLTYRCNERCLHCYVDQDQDGEMDTAEVQRVFDELSQAGTLFLTFSGGEIFLREDFLELAGHARRRHFDISLKTNATLVDAACAQRLKALGVRRVQVSIYSSDASVHDAVTRVAGSLARSVDAIRLLKAEGLDVGVACVLLRGNAGAYQGVQALAEDLGARLVLDATVTARLDGDQRPLSMRAPACELIPVLTDYKLNGGECAQLDNAGERAAAVSDPYADVPCSAGHNSAYISPNGDVYPCVQMPVWAGNLRRQTFAEIWDQSPQMRKIRSLNETSLPVCSACAIRPYCQRCPGLALIEEGGLTEPSRRACELAEQRARLAGFHTALSPYSAPGTAETGAHAGGGPPVFQVS
jgi:radical SAM protein with 4Fe4S-binding SPASM domain